MIVIKRVLSVIYIKQNIDFFVLIIFIVLVIFSYKGYIYIKIISEYETVQIEKPYGKADPSQSKCLEYSYKFINN